MPLLPLHQMIQECADDARDKMFKALDVNVPSEKPSRPRPLLIISDHVSLSTGLARIARDLASRIHLYLSDYFTVATLGLGPAQPDPSLPWLQYDTPLLEMDGRIPTNLEWVWRDLTRDSREIANGWRGIVLVIQNPGWCEWLAFPEKLRPSALKEFLLSRPFDKWGYFPIDGDGPFAGSLPSGVTAIIERFDRRLAYCEWAARTMDETLGAYTYSASLTQSSKVEVSSYTPTPHLPHGIDTAIFYPRDHTKARAIFTSRLLGKEMLIADDVLLVGIVATNSARKDYFLALQTCLILKQCNIDIRIWIHTNRLDGFWNLPELVEDFHLGGITLISSANLSDSDMAWCYSACDVTLGIGSGGGFEFPLAESLACGVPAIHGNYAGGTAVVPQSMLVEPIAFRGDVAGIRRPVFAAKDWADEVMSQVVGSSMPGEDSASVGLPSELDWNNLWPRWQAWLLEGISK